jgi:hypothetical protein
MKLFDGQVISGLTDCGGFITIVPSKVTEDEADIPAEQ